MLQRVADLLSLPEAQLDRFLLKIRMVYPDAKEEAQILQHYQEGFDPRYLEKVGLEALPEGWLIAAPLRFQLGFG